MAREGQGYPCYQHDMMMMMIYTGWNDKIVALEKTIWFHFRFMKTGFRFCCRPSTSWPVVYKSQERRSLLSCQKVTQCSTSEIGDAPLYNSCSLPTQVMTTGPLPAPWKCISGLSRITGTCPEWWKQSFRLRLWSLVWFQVRATSCHLTSSKSAWTSTPKCTWMCWRVWSSPGAIRWPVADPGCGSSTRRRPTSPKRPRLGFGSASLTGLPPPRPEPAGLLRSVIRREHHQHDLPQHQSQPDRRHPPLVEKACSQFQIRIEAVIEAEGRYIE